MTDDVGKNVYNFVAIAEENQRLYMQLLAGCSPQCGSWLAGWWRMALSHIWSSVTYHGRERKCGLAHSLPLPSTIHDSTTIHTSSNLDMLSTITWSKGCPPSRVPETSNLKGQRKRELKVKHNNNICTVIGEECLYIYVNCYLSLL